MGSRDNAIKDDDGFILRIPYLCPKCGEGFDTKHQRAGHLGGKHGGSGGGGHQQKLRKPIDHGSPNGARKHREIGEKPCQECKASWREYVQAWRKRSAPKKGNYLPPSLERFRRS